jgi:nucleotide-binding universal stress UspA family protein
LIVRILIATDGSKGATAAITAATRLLRPAPAHVSILCVAPEFHAPIRNAKKGSADKIREAYRHTIPKETRRILDEAQQALRNEGWEAEVLSDIGSPAEVIVNRAEDYDVTIIGAHGQNERTGPGLGPVASRVVEYASGVVLVGRELMSETGLRILVAVDGSSAAENAVNTMVRCFKMAAAEITLIHVTETPWIRLGLNREWFDYPGTALEQADTKVQLERELRMEAEDVVEEVQRFLERLGLSANCIIEEGNPATEILGQAESGEYDLVVLGAKGLADMKHEMLGSVSTKVARHAPCSVAVAKYSV